MKNHEFTGSRYVVRNQGESVEIYDKLHQLVVATNCDPDFARSVVNEMSQQWNHITADDGW